MKLTSPLKYVGKFQDLISRTVYFGLEDEVTTKALFNTNNMIVNPSSLHNIQ